MGAKDLMIGDWVFKDMNWSEEYPPYNGLDYQLYQIESGDDIDLACETNCIGDEDIYQSIPLTPEILELNGFIHVYTGSVESKYYKRIMNEQGSAAINVYFEKDMDVKVLVQIETELKAICGVNKIHNCEIEHVHILQHALRLCGLREFADNFKV